MLQTIRKLGEKNYRMRTSAQIDRDLLIDFSLDSYGQTLFRGLDLTRIDHLLITHSHEDHYCPTELLRVKPPMFGEDAWQGLERFVFDWVEGVDAALVDEDGFYYPISTTSLLLIYNRELANPPRDWTDWVNPEYEGLYQLHGLGGGTGKTGFASIVSRYQDPNGDLGISEEGWKIADDYFGNSHLIALGESLLRQEQDYDRI